MRVKTPVYLQNEEAECGAVALRSILAYHGLFVPAQELRRVCHVSRDGVRGDRLKQAASSYGLDTHVFQKSPATVRLVAPPFIAFSRSKHFAVIEGFHKGRVYINDPAYGRYTLADDEFDLQFSGVIFTCTPQHDFQRNRQPKTTLIGLIAFASQARTIFVINAIAGIILAVLGLAHAGVLRAFVEDVLADGTPILLALLLVTALIGILVSGLSAVVERQHRQTHTAMQVSNSLRLLRHMLGQPAAFFHARTGGQLAAHLIWAQDVTRFIMVDMVELIVTLLGSAAALVLLWLYDPLLPLFNIVLMAIYCLCFVVLSHWQSLYANLYQQRWGKLIGSMVFYLRQIESVKAVGSEGEVLARLQNYGVDILRSQKNLMSSTHALTITAFLFSIAQMSGMILIGASKVADGALTIGAFAALQALSMLIWIPLTGAATYPAQIRMVARRLEAIEDVLQAPRRADKSLLVASPPSRLTVHNLRFGYDSDVAPLFDDLSLTLEPGEIVAMVGSTGSGKSTLARLLTGLESPWSGTIKSGNPALADGNSAIFAGSIWDNVTLWDAAIGRADIKKAVADSELQTDIERLTGGYAARLSEDGLNLSGGQRQRIQIARALARNPDILILDEATSALDSRLEQRILHNLRARGCTCLIITHRLSLARQCDRILVLERGQIIESGTHDSLLEQDGQYARLNRVEPVAAFRLPAVPLLPEQSTAAVQRNQNTPDALSALVRGEFNPLFANLNKENALVAVCQIAFRAQGSELPAGDYHHADIVAIAEAGQVYARHVQLEPGWQTRDAGPLVIGGDQPTAFLYRRGRYWRADHTAYTLRMLTGADAAGLTGAYQFTVPLIQGAAGWRDLLRSVLRGCAADGWTMLASAVFVALAQLMPSVLIALLLDAVLTQATSQQWIQIVGLLVVVALFGALMLYTQQLAQLRIVTRIGLRLHNGLWAHILNLPTNTLNRFSSADLAARVSSVDAWVGALSTAGVTGLFAVLSFVAALIFIALYNLALALGLVLIAAGYLAILTPTAFAQMRALRDLAVLEGLNQGWLTALLNGVLHIQVCSAEESSFRAWLERELPARHADLQARASAGRLKVINAGLPWAVLITLFLAVSLTDLTVPLGLYIALQTAFILAGDALKRIGNALFSALPGIVSYDRLRPLLQAQSEHKTGVASLSQALTGAIRLDNVTVRYHPALPPALDGVSLDIRAGEFVAVVGPSGSGKTTLMRVLLGFEKPDRGRVYYNHQSLQTIDPRHLRRQIGAVMQHSILITGGSIFANIAAGRALTMEHAWQVARAAGIADEIAAMPMEMHTPLTEGGSALSSGQRQRLLIARALAGNPRILLFDEATAAVDDRTQSVILGALSDLQLTRVFVAHRLSMVKHADRIIVLDDGRVVQTGTFDELRTQPGFVANLVAEFKQDSTE